MLQCRPWIPMYGDVSAPLGGINHEWWRNLHTLWLALLNGGTGEPNPRSRVKLQWATLHRSLQAALLNYILMTAHDKNDPIGVSKINPHHCCHEGVGQHCLDSYDNIGATDTFPQSVVNRGRVCGKGWKGKAEVLYHNDHLVCKWSVAFLSK